MGWAANVARTWRRKMYTGFLWGNLKSINHFKDLDVNGRMLLNSSSKKYDGVVRIGFVWLRVGANGTYL
jgi:hypothetical protein